MKQLILSLFIVSMTAFLTACSGDDGKQEATDEKTEDVTSVVADPKQENQETGDAKGEDEEISTVSADKSDDSFIRFKANGTQMEATYKSKNNANATVFQRKKDDSYSLVVFERGTTEQMREALMISFINYNPRKLKFPIELASETDKLIQVDYKVKKSGVYITYFSNSQNQDNNFKVTLTGYSSGVLKGTFEGEVRNEAQKIIKIEDGEFEVKLKEVVIDANPA